MRGLAPYTNFPITVINTMKSVVIITITLLNLLILPIDGQSIVVKGNDCEFVNLAQITSNSGCASGTKFVLKVEMSLKIVLLSHCDYHCQNFTEIFRGPQTYESSS